MGVDCRVTFPNNVRVTDVATAIGILAGLKPIREPLQFGSFSVRVPGASVETASYIPECARIIIKPPDGSKLIDGEVSHWVLYHFEFDVDTKDPDIKQYARGILPPSTAFWVATAKRLIDLLGGKVDYNDSDDSIVDYEKPENPLNGAVNGKAWETRNNSLLKLKPLTKADLKEAKKVAAY